jgi:23S rRNA (adenine2503-C2)-methyltransferase
MKIKAAAGHPEIATVYLAEMTDGKYVEFVESVQPPIPKDKKWVMIVSTLYGCPVGCPICDAGNWYEGKLSCRDILDQIDYMVDASYPDRRIPANKFKIQFARMGEPSFNPNVLDVLEILPHRYHAPGLMPSLSTIAPSGSEAFFEKLLEIKDRYYSNGRFQLQFSIHSTDPAKRDLLLPVKKWDFEKIARYGRRFYRSGPHNRKITLNFALAKDSVISVEHLKDYFDPSVFLIKITPVNPTVTAQQNRILNHVKGDTPGEEPHIAQTLRSAGYDVIVSIGEWEENKIGSNCGQYIRHFLENGKPPLEESYQYQLQPLNASGGHAARAPYNAARTPHN